MEPPAEADPRDLAPEIRAQLRTLSKLAADRVARHLVAAGRLVDDDPEAALAQARAARALGARVAVVRQAAGETAYAAGEWAEAIAELRTARRMTGDDSSLPLIADAERALGRPDRALRLAQSPEARALAPADRAEMRIVEAGARRDLGQLDAALVTLQGPGLDRRTVQPWSARLWYAFADVLLAVGREDEARDWFVAAASVDPDGVTDAYERVLELDGVEIIADEGDDAEGGDVEGGDVEGGDTGDGPGDALSDDLPGPSVDAAVGPLGHGGLGAPVDDLAGGARGVGRGPEGFGGGAPGDAPAGGVADDSDVAGRAGDSGGAELPGGGAPGGADLVGGADHSGESGGRSTGAGSGTAPQEPGPTAAGQVTQEDPFLPGQAEPPTSPSPGAAGAAAVPTFSDAGTDPDQPD